MAKKTPDLIIGNFYGDWQILSEEPRPKEKFYNCKCKCGAIKPVSKSNLRLGKSTHCNKGTCRVSYTTHGHSNTSLYSVWLSMNARIKNPTGKNKCYQGLTIHEEWKYFQNFHTWAMSNGYQENLTIDRIDNTKGYSPTNCRWVTPLVQSQNRRKHSDKTNDLPKGVYISKPRGGDIKYKATGKAPYYWIVTYKGKRHQEWGFTTPEEAYNDRCKFIKENYDGLVFHD